MYKFLSVLVYNVSYTTTVQTKDSSIYLKSFIFKH